MRFFVFLAAFIACILLVVSALAGVRVGPDELGIRRIGFGPGKGYVQTPLSPGFHWSMPFLNYSTITTLPAATQVLDFHRPEYEANVVAVSELGKVHSGAWGEIDTSLLGPFTVKTRDGAQIICDVSLFVRFAKEPTERTVADGRTLRVEGPATLLQRLGSEPQRWVGRIREAASDAILRSLVSLSREEFYNFDARMAKLDEASVLMNESLAPFGIEVQAVLLRRYTYEADQIDEAIFLKNLQEQEEQRNATLVALEVQKKRLAELVAEYNARIKTTLVTGESEASIIRSDGDKIYALKVAEGDLALARGIAEGDKMQASALNSASGSEAYVARELAPLIAALQGGVVSDIDPFDLNSWIRKLGGGSGR